MIQELLGGVVEERKISVPGSLRMDPSSSAAASSPSQPSSVTSSPSSTSGPEQNLRCPRCDSSNTKFCYYNNYNLTQPRHFCKTCRRYWTKGGALRNVPIGGGCRKAKAAPSIAAAVGRSAAAKAKPAGASDPLQGRAGRASGLADHELVASAGLWASPHTSHLMALLRATSIQNPNSNPNPNPSPLLKEDGPAMLGVHTAAEPAGALNAAGLSFDPLGQLAVGPCSSLWRSTGQYLYQQQLQPQMQQSQQQGMLLAEAASSGMQELYQRLKSSSNYYSDHLPVSMSNVGSSDASRFSSSAASAMAAAGITATSAAASHLEPVPISGGDFGYWNPALSWADLPATNGAFP